MKVILLESIPHLGTVGDVVTVKNGYGRNYLLPQGKATVAKPKEIAHLDHQKRMLESKRKREMDKAEDLCKALEGMELTFARKTSDQDHIFGSVTPADVEREIHNKGYPQIIRKQIIIDRPIKALGEFDVTVRHPGGLKSQLKVTVAKEEELD